MTNMKTVRIFISSPGDVVQERDKARLVIAQLQKRYGDQAKLEQILWEDLPLQADMSFQQAIDLILSEHGVDIAVFILWSRLGSEVTGIARPDGTPYRSGTEREFDLMLAAREASPNEQKRPDVLVYTRDDSKGFASKLVADRSSDDLEEMIAQKKNAEEFIAEYFRDDQGRNLRAYHSFPKPIDFASRLKVHLTGLLEEHIGSTIGTRSWEGNPYVGLRAFQRDQADIFVGREREVDELATLLRSRERDPDDGCSFACVVGASGSGKSSLIRAGLAPELTSFSYGEDDRSAEWNFLSVTPAELLPHLPSGIVKLLAEPYPGLTAHATIDELSEALSANPETFVKLSLIPAVRQAGSKLESTSRTLLLIDQFEEFFTLPELKDSPEIVHAFLRFLELLARSGHFWVVATLRSDFYPSAQSLPNFLELRGSRNFDLLPPDGPSARRIITRPANLAGVGFETLDDKTGYSLADLLLKDIQNQPAALPLLQFALHDLFERGGSSGQLTLADYNAMGGLSGAIQTRAEETLAKVSEGGANEAVDESFPHLFSKLLTVDTSSGKETLVRRTATESELTGNSPASGVTRTLLDAFTEARLLTTSQQGGDRTYSVAHEALITGWPRLTSLCEKEAENLRRRSRLEPAQRNYLKNPDKSLLLASGLPLNEAVHLRDESPHLLTLNLRAYVDDSETHHRRRWMLSRLVVGITLVTFAALAGLALLAYLDASDQQQKAIAARETESKARTHAEISETKARKALEQSQKLVRFFSEDILAEGNPYQNTDPNLSMRTVIRKAGSNLEERFGEDPFVLATLELTIGEALVALGEYQQGLVHLETAVRVSDNMSNHPLTALNARQNLGRVLISLGRLDDAHAAFKKVKEDTEKQNDIIAADQVEMLRIRCLCRLCEIETIRGNFNSALQHAQAAESLCTDSTGAGLILDVSGSYAALYESEFSYPEALSFYKTSLAFAEKAYGTDSLSTWKIQQQIMFCLSETEQYSEVIALGEKLIPKLTDAVGVNHFLSLNTRAFYGIALAASGRRSDAVEILRPLVVANIEVYGEGTSSVATAYNISGYAYYLMKDYDKAIEFCTKAADMFSELEGATGPNTNLNHFIAANALADKGETDAAIAEYERIVENTEELRLQGNAKVLTWIDTLCFYYLKKNQHAKVVRVLSKTLPDYTSDELGVKSKLRRMYTVLGSSHAVMGKFEKAELVLRENVEISNRLHPDGNYETRLATWNLACVLLQQGKYEAALPVAIEASKPGSFESEEWIETESVLTVVDCLSGLERIDEAEALLIARIESAKNAKLSDRVAQFSNQLVLLLRDEARFADAIQFIEGVTPGEFPDSLQLQMQRGEAYCWNRLKQFAKSELAIQSSIDSLTKSSPDSWLLAHTRIVHAANQLALGEKAVTQEEFDQLFESLAKSIEQLPARHRKLRTDEAVASVVSAFEFLEDEESVAHWKTRLIPDQAAGAIPDGDTPENK